MTIPKKKGDAIVVDRDEPPREIFMEVLAKLKGVVCSEGSVTAGNASSVNDGACARFVADEAMAACQGLTPCASAVGMVATGVPPRTKGIGPTPATKEVLELKGLTLEKIDIVELNEAIAARGPAGLRLSSLDDDDPRLNPNGGAISLGHPLGASGARLADGDGEPAAAHRRPRRATHDVHRREPRDRNHLGGL